MRKPRPSLVHLLKIFYENVVFELENMFFFSQNDKNDFSFNVSPTEFSDPNQR